MISIGKVRSLEREMSRLGIRPEEISEKFIRASRPGGQNVNKVSTCVVIRHNPTGIEVRCQDARSQALNRFLARRLLVTKIERSILGKLSAEEMRIEKIRRQKRRRSRRARMKMLDAKKLHGEKKSLRRNAGAGFNAEE